MATAVAPTSPATTKAKQPKPSKKSKSPATSARRGRARASRARATAAAPSPDPGTPERQAEGSGAVTAAPLRAHGPVRVTLGALDQGEHLREALSFPVIESLPVGALIYDCLTHAAARRRGIVFISAKGNGKTVGIDGAMEQWDAREARMQLADGNYTPRTVLLLDLLRDDNERVILNTIYHAAFGIDQVQLVKNKPRELPDLRRELIDLLEAQSIVAIVVDEAESISDTALRVLRDLMSVAERKAKTRYVRGAAGERRTRAAGVGVLLLGTEELEPRIRNDREAGERWARIERAGLLPASELPGIYAELYPACGMYARQLGKKEWRRFITRLVAPGGLPVSLRLVENHLTEYHMVMSAETPTARVTSDIPFNEQVFRFAFNVARLAERPEVDADIGEAGDAGEVVEDDADATEERETA